MSVLIIIIIIIITLFQEDNIFGRVASLTYGPQLTNVGHDNIKMNRHACTIIYSMYRVNALRTPSRLRAGPPVEGEVRFFQAQDQPSVTTHVRVGNRVFSHSLDVVSKMHIYTLYTVIFFTCTIPETLFKLITHCFCSLLRCVEFSRSLTMSMH